jgi:cytochrome d ubiquinol oxidase subunit II
LLDWYTVSIAILAAVMLAAHGATYLTLKTEGPVHDRSERWAKYLWIAVVPLAFVVLIESRIVRPDLPGRALSNPFWWIGLVVIAISTIALVSGLSGRRERRAFLASNFLIVGLLATGAAAIFPVMLHSTLAPENSLTAYAVASSPTTLLRASFWWPVGFALAVFYSVFISRRYAGKVSVQHDTQGF